MIDFHCHLDLYPNAVEVARECAVRKIYILSVTTTPSAWYGTAALADDAPTIRTAIGLHPQLAAAREHELPLLDKIVPTTRYVGEVGLDGGPEFKQTWDAQLRVFSHVLRICSDNGGKILSLHSRRATSAVLDHLELFPRCGVPILHWFSGSFTELDRAKKLGCWFSVGPAMLKSRKGQELAARMPIDRVLTETDGPFAQKDAKSLKPWDVAISSKQLSQIWAIDAEEANSRIASNLRSLALAEVKPAC